MVVVARGKDVGALDRLIEIPENVVDDDDSLCGVVGAGGVLQTRCQRDVKRLPSGGRPLHVFKPSTSSYEPFALYPVETTGGTLQQATEWPCVAGIVDILAAEIVLRGGKAELRRVRVALLGSRGRCDGKGPGDETKCELRGERSA